MTGPRDSTLVDAWHQPFLIGYLFHGLVYNLKHIYTSEFKSLPLIVAMSFRVSSYWEPSDRTSIHGVGNLVQAQHQRNSLTSIGKTIYMK
jgi:hypothetical protein